jgi:hypothetical protein
MIRGRVPQAMAANNRPPNNITTGVYKAFLSPTVNSRPGGPRRPRAMYRPTVRKGKVYICTFHDLCDRGFPRQGREMEGTERRFDADTLRKIEQINHKIDEINQRKIGIHTTHVEDELDRQELDSYIKNLQLTDNQRQIIDRYNHNKDTRASSGSDWVLFVILAVGVFLQFYIGYEVYRLVSKGALETLETVYLAFLVMFFAFNTFQMLRYLRVVR